MPKPTAPFKPAEAFPPGEFIRQEIEARGWTQSDLARVIGRPLQTVNMIVNGKKAVTAETAKALGLAFGTGPELWLNLETAYRLHTTADADPAIVERAQALAGAA
ncbi:MAG TPA: HigA family addiction module antitoxin [Tepidisphaeraceae bacterium]|jgi:HTH-type transcriptional regulator/antitoxin HigA